MFDLSIWEIAIVAVVAILVIGPSELPKALVTAGKWLRKFRSITSNFRTGLDAMVRETEMQELEKKWAEKNKQIMADNPNEMMPLQPHEHGNDLVDVPVAEESVTLPSDKAEPSGGTGFNQNIDQSNSDNSIKGDT